MKMRRGGQHGDRNARTHGLYSSQLTPGELDLYDKFVNQEHVDPPVAILRIKLWNVIRSDPHNHGALAEISNLLADWYAAFYRYDRDELYTLKRFIDVLIQNLVFQELRARYLVNNYKYFQERIDTVLPPDIVQYYSQLIANSADDTRFPIVARKQLNFPERIEPVLPADIEQYYSQLISNSADGI